MAAVVIPALVTGSFFGFSGSIIGLFVGLISSLPAFPRIFSKKIKAKEDFTEFELRSLIIGKLGIKERKLNLFTKTTLV
ncbi:MAG: hypothetical protein ACO2OV_05830 [Thermoproteota archaeon]